jgi:hypothetical protein
MTAPDQVRGRGGTEVFRFGPRFALGARTAGRAEGRTAIEGAIPEASAWSGTAGTAVTAGAIGTETISATLRTTIRAGTVRTTAFSAPGLEGAPFTGTPAVVITIPGAAVPGAAGKARAAAAPPLKTASFEAAPGCTALGTAPIETAALGTTPLETAPIAGTPIKSSAVGSPALKTTPFGPFSPLPAVRGPFAALPAARRREAGGTGGATPPRPVAGSRTGTAGGALRTGIGTTVGATVGRAAHGLADRDGKSVSSR